MTALTLINALDIIYISVYMLVILAGFFNMFFFIIRQNRCNTNSLPLILFYTTV